MNQRDQQTYKGLRFEARRQLPFPPGVITVAVILLVYFLLWKYATPGVFFWLSFLMVGIITSMATFGWRVWLRRLITWLQNLENH